MVAQHADQAMHEAARAGQTDTLAETLRADSPLINAKGMDARTPLHCAGTVAVAALLLDHGARIDARDEDHDSTPAPVGHEGRGGTIYQWTLGFNSYPHQVLTLSIAR